MAFSWKGRELSVLSEAQKALLESSWAAAIFLPIHQPLHSKASAAQEISLQMPFGLKLFHQQKLPGYGEVGFRTGKMSLLIKRIDQPADFFF